MAVMPIFAETFVIETIENFNVRMCLNGTD